MYNWVSAHFSNFNLYQRLSPAARRASPSAAAQSAANVEDRSTRGCPTRALKPEVLIEARSAS